MSDAFSLREGKKKTAPCRDSGKFGPGRRCWGGAAAPVPLGDAGKCSRSCGLSEALPLQEVKIAAFVSLWKVSVARNPATSFNFLTWAWAQRARPSVAGKKSLGQPPRAGLRGGGGRLLSPRGSLCLWGGSRVAGFEAERYPRLEGPCSAQPSPPSPNTFYTLCHFLAAKHWVRT